MIIDSPSQPITVAVPEQAESTHTHLDTLNVDMTDRVTGKMKIDLAATPFVNTPLGPLFATQSQRIRTQDAAALSLIAPKLAVAIPAVLEAVVEIQGIVAANMVKLAAAQATLATVEAAEAAKVEQAHSAYLALRASGASVADRIAARDAADQAKADAESTLAAPRANVATWQAAVADPAKTPTE